MASKYAFNHDAANVPECLGIPEGRFQKLQEAARFAVLSALVTDPEINNNAQMLELAINRVAPLTEVEAIILGYMTGKNEVEAHIVVKNVMTELKE